MAATATRLTARTQNVGTNCTWTTHLQTYLMIYVLRQLTDGHFYNEHGKFLKLATVQGVCGLI